MLFCASCASRSTASIPEENRLVINRTYQGYATWYSSGRKTANGSKFDPNAMTVAHRKLPFGTILVLTNPENGNSIRVIVNDRGPFKKDKELDVSRGVADVLGFQKKGLAKLRIDVLQNSQ